MAKRVFAPVQRGSSANGVLAFVVAILLWSSGATAQRSPLGTVAAPRLTTEQDCPTPNLPPQDFGLLEACVSVLVADVGLDGQWRTSLPAGLPPRDDARQIHVDVLQKYATFLVLKQAAVTLLKRHDAAERAVEHTLQRIGALIHAVLQEHDIEETEPVVGELRARSALSDAGAFENGESAVTGPKRSPTWCGRPAISGRSTSSRVSISRSGERSACSPP